MCTYASYQKKPSHSLVLALVNPSPYPRAQQIVAEEESTLQTHTTHTHTIYIYVCVCIIQVIMVQIIRCNMILRGKLG